MTTHRRVDCATGRRMTTAAECEAHAATCAAYAAERAANRAAPAASCGNASHEAQRAEWRYAAALRDRIRDHS